MVQTTMLQVECPHCDAIIEYRDQGMTCCGCGNKINADQVQAAPEEYFDEMKVLRSRARRMSPEERVKIAPLREALKKALTTAALYMLAPHDPRVTAELKAVRQAAEPFREWANEDMHSIVHKVFYRVMLIADEVERLEFEPEKDVVWLRMMSYDDSWEPVSVYTEKFFGLDSDIITMAGDEIPFRTAKGLNVQHAIEVGTQALVF